MYRSSSHSSISAFSPHANPDEDWTKISDLKARRRIQNRIAQRNYRKKLNRRLDGSEHHAASLASSPEPVTPPKAARSKPRTKQLRACKATNNKAHTAHTPAPERPASYDYYTTTQDDRGMFGHCLRQLSASPSPVFSCQSLSTYDPYRPSYRQMPVYRTVPSSYGDISLTDYSEALPSVVPSVNTRGKGHKPNDEDMMSTFCMSYATMGSVDVEQSLPVTPIGDGYPHGTTQGHSHDHDHRAALTTTTSPESSIFAFPLTPETPCSPFSLRSLFEYDLRQ